MRREVLGTSDISSTFWLDDWDTLIHHSMLIFILNNFKYFGSGNFSVDKRFPFFIVNIELSLLIWLIKLQFSLEAVEFVTSLSEIKLSVTPIKPVRLVSVIMYIVAADAFQMKITKFCWHTLWCKSHSIIGVLCRFPSRPIWCSNKFLDLLGTWK